MLFRAQLEECTCLTPIPSSTQGICFELNSRNPAILPLKHHQKPCRTPYKVHQLGLTAAKSPSGGHVPLGATASRPPGGGHVPPGAERLVNNKVWNYRPAGPYIPPGGYCIQQSMALPLPPGETSYPPGATNSSTPLFHCYRLAASPPTNTKKSYNVTHITSV
ncbi:hypothetical protein DEO72_LG7g890 [Vigna unguiculata]|uniref:Uncharacterized protein n=1 Tax=Vigna unguiculata TaxID=3917 RepID=A0A4D6MHX6_VIGUN|nr:hypothetical protein DEO72_LG7g890 [Vigna unguiculata]